SVEDAFLQGLEPGLVEAARDRVDLHAERGNREGVDDVLRGDVDFDYLADRHIGRVVDREQANLPGLEVLVLLDDGIEGETAFRLRIAVVPMPLRGGHLQRHVRRWNDEL